MAQPMLKRQRQESYWDNNMTEQDVQKLRDAGISDATILELQNEDKKTGAVAPAETADTAALPTIDPNTPSTVFKNAEASGVPTQGREPTAGQTAMEVGKVAAGAALPFTLGVGVAKLGPRALNAMRGMAGGAGSVPVTTAPVNPTAINLPSAPAPAAAPAATPPGVQAANPAANQVMRDFVQQQGKFAPPQPTQQFVPQSGAQAAPRNVPVMDKASQIVRQLALDKLLKGAGAPAAVAAGGAAATGLAARQMGAMTPEQRRQFYESPMMGAMSGDAGLAAAIMNRGQ